MVHMYLIFSSEPVQFEKFDRPISPEELAEDFHTLRAILQSSPLFGNYLVGPDLASVSNNKTASFFKRYSYVTVCTVYECQWI